jgi:cobalamin biosynthesis protein CobT
MEMTKLAMIVGGVVLMAGVALAGTLTSLGSSSTPAGQTITPPAATTTDLKSDDRGQEAEQRGRENEAGEDVSGPCDEAEHANDPRCTGAAGADDRGADHGVDDNGHHGQNSGHGGDDGSSGHGGSNSGHGGGEDD